MNSSAELIQALFRKEFAKMVAVISKLFGLQHIEVAEDIVSDTFLKAAEDWGLNGVPPNPAAWLYLVAKNKTLAHFRRSKIFSEKVSPAIQQILFAEGDTELLDFTTENILDSQLRMMFAICDPVITSEAQIGLALRVLCGFGIEEIAEAFFTNKETINKRLFRAKTKLREKNLRLEFPPEPEIASRLDNVLHIIYLLFNEGYYSSTAVQKLRKEFCMEAIGLGQTLMSFDKTATPKTAALMALMCFHASRIEARSGSEFEVILYDEQDETMWSAELITKGKHFLSLSAAGDQLSSYHLEAGIAFWHSHKQDTAQKWEHILSHYNLLLQINHSQVVALNRIYALYKVAGEGPALAEMQRVVLKNHFYFTLLGKLLESSDVPGARRNYQMALALCNTPAEQALLQQKLSQLIT